MRFLPWIVAASFVATSAQAQEVRRLGAGTGEGGRQLPISASVEVPSNFRLVYVSGTVPELADAQAPQGSIARYGDTATQTRSVLRRIGAQLAQHGLTLGDVVMMRVFLVAPPGSERMDFAGMMTAYSEFFNTQAQPNRPARSTIQVAGLVDPGWLVEIEVTAAAR